MYRTFLGEIRKYVLFLVIAQILLIKGHSVELEKRKVKNQSNNNEARLIARTAARIATDIDFLWKQGTSPCTISGILGIHPSTVEKRVAQLERDEAESKEFLQTGELSSEGGYLAIFQS